ncbi:hypothetical protein STEG23_036850, partial [Scotinomys teguina]
MQQQTSSASDEVEASLPVTQRLQQRLTHLQRKADTRHPGLASPALQCCYCETENSQEKNFLVQLSHWGLSETAMCVKNILIRLGVRNAQVCAGPNLKEWLREQFCDHPLEHCEDTRLHDAAYVGDLQTLRNLLQEESYRSRINEKSVWCCGWLPCTPLRIAATAGHGNCVDFLIRKGAEVDLVDVKGQTALYVAVVNGHLESTEILLEAGADPNGSRHHRSTPVYHASRVGRDDILKALIRFVNTVYYNGISNIGINFAFLG